MSDKKLIGYGADQVSTNGMLGNMAFQSSDSVNIIGGSVSDSVLSPNVFLKNSAQTLTNKLTTAPSTSLSSPFNIPPGVSPTSPENGDIWSTTTGLFARVNNTTYQLNTETPDVIELLLVAGGGGGGSTNTNAQPSAGGGGGAGGALHVKFVPVVGQTYSVEIGNGGPAGTNGANSTFGTYTAVGGGGGVHLGGVNGSNGGSGGGGSSELAGRGTDGQGNNGGNGTGFIGAGGGGAGENGRGINSSNISNGGTGVKFYGKTYAGGGAGGAPRGLGGIGGGADATTSTDWDNGKNGAINTGGGGSGAYANTTSSTYTGGNGGSGVAIIVYPGQPRASGGNIVFSGGMTTHTFTGSGSFIWNG